jgi:hypothetical protein
MMHPGVAEAGRNRAGTLFREAADTEAAAFWATVYQHASGDAGEGSLDTGLQVRAGLAAVPYLIRQVIAWHVCEGLLDTGHAAAVQLQRWTDALDFNTDQVDSLRARNAPASDIARTLFGNYPPLLELGRTSEALALLRECLRSFQDAQDTTMIGE